MHMHVSLNFLVFFIMVGSLLHGMMSSPLIRGCISVRALWYVNEFKGVSGYVRILQGHIHCQTVMNELKNNQTIRLEDC